MDHGSSDGRKRVVVAKFDFLRIELIHGRAKSLEDTYADGDGVIFVHDGHDPH